MVQTTVGIGYCRRIITCRVTVRVHPYAFRTIYRFDHGGDNNVLISFQDVTSQRVCISQYQGDGEGNTG